MEHYNLFCLGDFAGSNCGLGDCTGLNCAVSVQRQTLAERALRSYNAGASIANMNTASSANAAG